MKKKRLKAQFPILLNAHYYEGESFAFFLAYDNKIKSVWDEIIQFCLFFLIFFSAVFTLIFISSAKTSFSQKWPIHLVFSCTVTFLFQRHTHFLSFLRQSALTCGAQKAGYKARLSIDCGIHLSANKSSVDWSHGRRPLAVRGGCLLMRFRRSVKKWMKLLSRQCNN